MLFVLVVAAGLAAYVHFAGRTRSGAPAEAAYVLPESLEVVDTPAELRRVVTRLKNGDKVEVLLRTRHWAKVRLADGNSGWIEKESLVDSATHEQGERLAKELRNVPPQAAGHMSALSNLRVEPTRDAPLLARLSEKQNVGVFGRRLVERPTPPDQPAPSAPVRDAWYLVRAGSWAGWVMGKFVDLDVPQGISQYAQDVNVVAWLVLKTVDDEGKPMPEYLVADRMGGQEFDFSHVRVFTWWAKRHTYVTAYVESGLNGYFPIRVTPGLVTSYFKFPSPYFRLRLMDSDSHKFQKVYGLFDTIVRPVGTVEGWESEAMPAPQPRESKAGKRRNKPKRNPK